MTQLMAASSMRPFRAPSDAASASASTNARYNAQYNALDPNELGINYHNGDADLNKTTMAGADPEASIASSSLCCD